MSEDIVNLLNPAVNNRKTIKREIKVKQLEIEKVVFLGSSRENLKADFLSFREELKRKQ